MRKRSGLALLALAGLGVVRYRRSILARLLKLPPPDNAVRVQRNIPIAMPDDVRLLADHYSPKAEGNFPTILIRTPYGRGREGSLASGYPLAELPAQRFAERGYHVLVQGARGCFDSEGEWSPHVNEAADGRATVDWIAQQPWFNGVLGTWGPSYLGYMQWALAAATLPQDSQESVGPQAMLIMISSSENWTVSHPDGSFGLETRLRWSQGIHEQNRLHGRPLREQLLQRFRGDAEARLQAAFDHLPLLEADTVAAGEPLPFFRGILVHRRSEDAYWLARDHRDAVAQFEGRVHLVGGWYDYYLRGLLRDYAALKAAGRQPFLTIGPWHHADPNGMMAGLREGLGWFDAQLKGDYGRLSRKPVRICVMGAGARSSGEWRELDDFPPPARPARYYLRERGGLAIELPAATSPPDVYRYDPADPTPAVGGALLALQGAGAQDNRSLEERADVLCYTTLPLDQAIEIIGPVRLQLYVRSSLAHTDFFGRLCDVAPDGRSTNVCDGLFRVEPGRGDLQPDGSLRIKVDMWATAYRFQPGHRVRLQVSSGAHPRWSRNLGTGEALAEGAGLAVADQAVYHDESHPSALVLPVVDME